MFVVCFGCCQKKTNFPISTHAPYLLWATATRKKMITWLSLSSMTCLSVFHFVNIEWMDG